MRNIREYNSAETGWIRKATAMGTGNSALPITFPLRSQVNILKHGLMENQSSSRPDHLLGEIRSWQEVREQRLTQIRAIKGKYASALTNSEAFAQRKREEIELER